MKRIKVGLSFPALLCILGWLDGWLCLWFAVAVTIHELGHLVLLKLCRVSVTSVQISCFGAKIETGIMTEMDEILCALAGPATGLLAALLCLRLQPGFALVSGCLSAANLLPIYPLDGGRVLFAALSRCRKRETILRNVRFVTCCCLMLLACWLTTIKQAGLWPVFLALAVLCRAGTREKQLLFQSETDTIERDF